MKNLILFLLMAVSNVAFAQSYDNKNFKDWLVRMDFEGSSDEERIKSLLKQDSLQTSHDLKFLHCKGQEELKAEIKKMIKKEEEARKVFVSKRVNGESSKKIINKKTSENSKYYYLAKKYLKAQGENCVGIDYDKEDDEFGGGYYHYTEEEGTF